MLILFCTYASIVFFFATLYLAVSKIGQTTESDSDGSERLVPYCQMEIHNLMEALYLSQSTMASIGYGGSWLYLVKLCFVMTLDSLYCFFPTW